MKRILVVYYTQSGQLREIIDSVVAPLLQESDITVEYEELKPVMDYPFPWGDSFFDCFPESVMDIPCALKPFTFSTETKYDLIILAYQSWFMSPSIPFSSFIQTREAQQLLKGRQVVTLLGIRNMWISAQEIIRQKLSDAGAHLIGNIVLADRHNNWIAGITIIRWLVYGKRGPAGILPRAGVSDADIRNASRFGKTIYEALQANRFGDLQQKLVAEGAVQVKFDLMLIERNARKIFIKFARNIIRRSTISAEKRSGGIRIFKWYLLFALFLLAPIASVIFTISGLLFYPLASKQIRYYQGI
ncbi:MAG: dialkylresorcinol condensing enzyme DarA [Bacteroidota bacterium]